MTAIAKESDIRVLSPGTPSVIGWPIRPSNVRRVIVDKSRERVFMWWDRLSPRDWPFHEVTRGGEVEPEYLGVLWLVTPAKDGGRPIEAAPAEQLRWERERNLTEFSFEHITGDGARIPKDGELVGVFPCGPSRHMKDRREYRYRGEIQYFVWGDGDLEAYEPEEPGEEPGEEPEGDLVIRIPVAVLEALESAVDRQAPLEIIVRQGKKGDG